MPIELKASSGEDSTRRAIEDGVQEKYPPTKKGKDGFPGPRAYVKDVVKNYVIVEIPDGEIMIHKFTMSDGKCKLGRGIPGQVIYRAKQ